MACAVTPPAPPRHPPPTTHHHHLHTHTHHTTPCCRQVLIYQALGFPTPIFGHVSLILAPDKSKLSKRHGATSVGEFREEGYLAAVSGARLGAVVWALQASASPAAAPSMHLIGAINPGPGSCLSGQWFCC